MSRVAVVTDSTAYLPDGVAEKHDIGVVPLHVVLGRLTGAEGVEVSPADVASALGERRVQVTTSRPTPAELAAAYRATGASLRRVGAPVLKLSGTVEARPAARPSTWPLTGSRYGSSTAGLSRWDWASRSSRLRRWLPGERTWPASRPPR